MNYLTDSIVSTVKLAYNYYLEKKEFFLKNYAYVAEFRIAKIYLSRQCGHTTAALQLFQDFPNSILFLHDHSFRRALELTKGDKALMARIFPAGGISAFTSYHPHSEPELVIVDDASNVKKERLDALMSRFNDAFFALIH